MLTCRIAHDLIGRVRTGGQTLNSSRISTEQMAQLIKYQHSKTLTAPSIKIMLHHMLKNSITTIDEAMVELGMKSNDTPSLQPTIDSIIADNPKQMQKFLKGDDKIIMWFIGQAMRKTSGKAEPDVVRQYLHSLRTNS